MLFIIIPSVVLHVMNVTVFRVKYFSAKCFHTFTFLLPSYSSSLLKALACFEVLLYQAFSTVFAKST